MAYVTLVPARPRTVPAAPHSERTVPRAILPPVGPGWYGSVMGTGILAALLGLHAPSAPDLLVPATAVLLVGWALLVGLSVGFGARILADRAALTSTLTEAAVAPMWGTVSMGILSVGSATLIVAPQVAPALAHGALVADLVLWCVGTLLGLATTLAFLGAVVRRDLGAPTPVWGLPVVPPMVSATTGAALVPHLASPTAQLALLVVSVACFVVSLVIGGVVFAAAYHQHARVSQVPLAAAATLWIPLGVVGQSMAAAQAIAVQSDRFLSPAAVPAVHGLAHAYGDVMLVAAVPVVVVAVVATVRGFRARMPFSPAWWSLTFPLGTLALGAHLLGSDGGHAAVSAIGVVALAGLVGTWTLCAVATLRAVAASRSVEAARGAAPV